MILLSPQAIINIKLSRWWSPLEERWVKHSPVFELRWDIYYPTYERLAAPDYTHHPIDCSCTVFNIHTTHTPIITAHFWGHLQVHLSKLDYRWKVNSFAILHYKEVKDTSYTFITQRLICFKCLFLVILWLWLTANNIQNCVSQKNLGDLIRVRKRHLEIQKCYVMRPWDRLRTWQLSNKHSVTFCTWSYQR